jgi:hypothetical protein
MSLDIITLVIGGIVQEIRSSEPERINTCEILDLDEYDQCARVRFDGTTIWFQHHNADCEYHSIEDIDELKARIARYNGARQVLDQRGPAFLPLDDKAS